MANEFFRVQALDTERLTVSITAVSLASVPSGAQVALIRVKNAAICFTEDGVTTPTASVGMEAEAGEIIKLETNPSKFKAIRRDSSDATLVVTYYTEI